MKPLIMAAAFAFVTIAQPWKAGDTMYNDVTWAVDQYLASQAAAFDTWMRGQVDLAMLGRVGAALTLSDAVESCGGKAVLRPAPRHGQRSGARRPGAPRVFCSL